MTTTTSPPADPARLFPEATPRPWRLWENALWIQADNVPKGPMHVADVRGWGYLTGKGDGALGLTSDEAFAIQQANARLIVYAVNSIGPLLELAHAIADGEGDPQEMAQQTLAFIAEPSR